MIDTVITGAGGLLGSNLASDFSKKGISIAPLDRAAGGPDITGSAAMETLLRDLAPRRIIHCAALTDVDWCEANPAETHRVNAAASGHLAAIARRIGAGFVYISTDSVFDGERGDYDEGDSPNPLNVYARAKWAGEKAVLAEHPRALVVRTNIYGWNRRPKRSLAEWILDRLERDLEVPGFQDVRFCPILVNDLADLLLEMTDLPLHGVYHVSGSEAVSKYEFAVAIARVFGYHPARVVSRSLDGAGLKAPRPLNTSLCVSKVSNALGRRLPGLSAGLERFGALRTVDAGYAHA